MLLSVGSLTPLKGFDFLIQAVAGIPCNQRPSLIIASNFQSPPERDYLKQLATELNVDLKLLANIRDKHLVRLYNQARVVVYAPIREPSGLVPLEAMACDTPVVGVREGGVPESIVHQHTGLLVERDPAQFAAAIQHLLSNPSLASEYGRNGREHVLRNWTWDESVATLEHHLATCAGL
jgi:glycosyltransferase involved in cell wall biosynthesis